MEMKRTRIGSRLATTPMAHLDNLETSSNHSSEDTCSDKPIQKLDNLITPYQNSDDEGKGNESSRNGIVNE